MISQTENTHLNSDAWGVGTQAACSFSGTRRDLLPSSPITPCEHHGWVAHGPGACGGQALAQAARLQMPTAHVVEM